MRRNPRRRRPGPGIRYYIFALLFVVFDAEVVFLFPWAVVLRELGMHAYVLMVIFLVMLVDGLVYAWRKGFFDGCSQHEVLPGVVTTNLRHLSTGAASHHSPRYMLEVSPAAIEMMATAPLADFDRFGMIFRASPASRI